MADEPKRPIILNVGEATDEELDAMADVLFDYFSAEIEQALVELAKRPGEQPEPH